VAEQPVRLADRGQERGPFEQFAERATTLVSGAAFFAGCALLVLVWLGSYFLFGDPDTWQLVINTVTTIVTFLLVALLQNSQRRSATALHEKLDAIADGLADLMEHQIDRDPEDLTGDIDELKAAVGLQHKR
jgi:low affinity Fe/Cu permease